MGLGSCRISDNKAGLVQTGDMLQVTCYTAHDTSCALYRIVSVVKGKSDGGQGLNAVWCVSPAYSAGAAVSLAIQSW
jgi:hypothetical protein